MLHSNTEKKPNQSCESTTSNDGSKKEDQPEDFETFRRKQISEASTDVVESLTSIAPQVSENGEINYYICGSLAQNILPSISKLQVIQQDKNGKKTLTDDIPVTEEMKRFFLTSVRKKGNDFDVVTMHCTPEDSAKKNGFIFLDFKLMEEKCADKSALSIIQDKPAFAKPNFDYLNETQESEDGFGDYYYSIATLKDGKKAFIASPAALIGGKAFELLHIRRRLAEGQKVKEEKLEKDEKDLRGLCQGFVQFYGVENLTKKAIEAMQNRIDNNSKIDSEEIRSQLAEMIAEFSA